MISKSSSAENARGPCNNLMLNMRVPNLVLFSIGPAKRPFPPASQQIRMTPQNTLDVQGNLRTYPLAELIVEIAQANLSGSLRLCQGNKKTIIYFKEGTVTYGVSNARSMRLFSILIEKGKITQTDLSQYPNFTSDLEFAAALQAGGAFSREQVDEVVTGQIESVIIDALTWPDGEWTFSPLAQLRKELCFKVDVFRVLADYARCMPADVVTQRFKSVNEIFSAAAAGCGHMQLQAQESYILSRFSDGPLSIEQLRLLCSIPEAAMLQTLYMLWMSGMLIRRDWNSAFPAAKVGVIRAAKVSLVREAANRGIPQPMPAEKPAEAAVPEVSEPAEEAPKTPEFTISLEEYLAQAEGAATLYDVLSLESTAAVSEIKSRYFAMAKLFHPDRYHRESGETLRRIQVAFTKLAQAYETLKNPETRESYDFKIRKELEKRAQREAAGQPDTSAAADQASDLALESFETGVSYLADEDYATAAAYLARAVHYNSKNALYHAYYGKALSEDERQRHKAESEMQTAARLDPKNPKIRIMLAQFFIDMNMTKRAEGELRRFLELVPNNREAENLLSSLTNQPLG